MAKGLGDMDAMGGFVGRIQNSGGYSARLQIKKIEGGKEMCMK